MACLAFVAHWGYMTQGIKPSGIVGRQTHVTAVRCHWQATQFHGQQPRNLHFHPAAVRERFCDPGAVVMNFRRRIIVPALLR